jgi:hypothetical protein
MFEQFAIRIRFRDGSVGYASGNGPGGKALYDHEDEAKGHLRRMTRFMSSRLRVVVVRVVDGRLQEVREVQGVATP